MSFYNVVILQSPPKESIRGGARGNVGGVSHPPLSWTNSMVGLAHLLLFIQPPSVLSTRLDKSVYFLLGETVKYQKIGQASSRIMQSFVTSHSWIFPYNNIQHHQYSDHLNFNGRLINRLPHQWSDNHLLMQLWSLIKTFQNWY